MISRYVNECNFLGGLFDANSDFKRRLIDNKAPSAVDQETEIAYSHTRQFHRGAPLCAVVGAGFHGAKSCQALGSHDVPMSKVILSNLDLGHSVDEASDPLQRGYRTAYGVKVVGEPMELVPAS